MLNVHVVFEVLLYVHRNRRFITEGSPGRPPRLSHGSRALLTSTETIRLIKVGEKRGKWVWRWGKRRLYTYRYTVTTRMTVSCIKMGSDESHFSASLIVRDKVTRQRPQTTTFLKRKENRSGIGPRSFCLPA